MAQWLGLRASTAGGMSSTPDQGTKIPQAVQCRKKKIIIIRFYILESKIHPVLLYSKPEPFTKHDKLLSNFFKHQEPRGTWPRLQLAGYLHISVLDPLSLSLKISLHFYL